MLLQHPGQAGLVAKRSYLETPAEGIPVEQKLQRIVEATKQYQAAHPRKPGGAAALSNTINN